MEPQETTNRAPLVRRIGIPLGIVLILGGLVFGAYSLGRRSPSNVAVGPTASPTPATTPTVKPSPRPTLTAVTPVTDEGVTWLSEGEQLADLGLFESLDKDNSLETGSKVTYYKAGTDAGKDIILAIAPYPGMGNYDVFFHFIKKSDTSYELVVNNSQKPDSTGNYEVWKLSKKVTAKNTTKTYKSIDYQTELEVKGAKLKAEGNYPTWYPAQVEIARTNPEDTKLEEYASTPYGKVYLNATKREGNYTIQSFLLRRPNNVSVAYQLRPSFITDDYVPQITWSDGSTNKDTYRTDGMVSCGSRYGIAVLNDPKEFALKESGKSNKGEVIYDITNQSSKLVNVFYQQYALDYSSQEAIDQKRIRSDAVSLSEYLKKHALVTYKDALGRYVLLSSTVYGIQAECGKPVIYLYPEKKTEVSVKVDAKITVSEPEYNEGWSVIAEPNGQLTMNNGQKYDSLYWEGLGKDYPDIKQGFVVPRAEVEQTLWNHLAKLGLNQKESKDFMEFWLPRIPHTPYVRLTWFGTREMDRLAPLAVSPQPDTSIRVFLDFEGLMQPVQLPEQRLTTIPRKGFTLIEWGGLLRK